MSNARGGSTTRRNPIGPSKKQEANEAGRAQQRSADWARPLQAYPRLLVHYRSPGLVAAKAPRLRICPVSREPWAVSQSVVPFVFSLRSPERGGDSKRGKPEAQGPRQARTGIGRSFVGRHLVTQQREAIGSRVFPLTVVPDRAFTGLGRTETPAI